MVSPPPEGGRSGERSGLSDRVSKTQGTEDGKERYEELKEFFGVRNQASLQSRHENGADLRTFHRLDLPGLMAALRGDPSAARSRLR
jgi:hypothetical protein